MKALADIEDNSVDAIITDPPYGANFISNWVAGHKAKAPIANDSLPFIWFLPEAYRILKPNSVLICFTDWKRQEAWRQAITYAGFKVKSQGVWDKDWHGMGDLKGSLAPQHELFWFATKGSFAFTGPRLKSVIRTRRPSANVTPHPTAKSVELMRRLCESVCPKGVVLDPFMGIGSTGMAAVDLGLDFIGIEIDKTYFDIAKRQISARKKRKA